MSVLLTCLTFWALLGFTLAEPRRRARAWSRSARDWCLDLTGLLVQGVAIPYVLVVPLFALRSALWPSAQSAWSLPAWASFAIAFVGVDYLYYWNHRLLHTRALWRTHAVHHSAEQMDVLVTSRNTLWTSLLVVYLWATAVFTFLLRDPAPYLVGAGLTAALDLVRHSPLSLRSFPLAERLLGGVFVLPSHHARHHADLPHHGNFGANLIWWDKLHGTFREPGPMPERLGVDNPLGLARSLFWPY